MQEPPPCCPHRDRWARPETRRWAAPSCSGLLVDAAEYAIFLLGPDGTVRTWNSGAQRLKGYRAEEIVGRHLAVFYPAEDVAAGKPERELATAAREGSCPDDGWRVRADGSRFWAYAVIPALYEGGELRGYAKVTRDDTAARAGQERAEALAETHSWIASPAGEGKTHIRAVDGELAGPQVGERLPAAGTVAQRVLDSGELVFVDDLPGTSTLGVRVAGAGAALSVPLVAAEHTRGCC